MTSAHDTAPAGRGHNQTRQKQPQKPASAPPQTTQAAPSSDSLQRATANPQAATPADILALQRTAGNRAVQRLIDDTTHPGRPEGGPVEPATEDSIQRSRGGGTRLPGTVRGPMEQAFGADFGPVRVHTGEGADRLNRSMSARAFTTGSDIFFSQGAYNPASSDGKRLLAHELTHVVQQGGSQPTAQRSLKVGPAGDQYEQEADRVAGQVVQRAAAPGISRAPAGVQREETQQVGENGPKIKSEDFEYEVFAHKIAYKGITGAEAWLDRIGYEPREAAVAKGFGFMARLILPKEGSGRTAVIAFKGTNRKSDFIADIDPVAVGFFAFKHNQDKVKAMIDQAGGRVDAVGHSLGAALAQHCASAFPGNVRRVVGFQAPGISTAQALMFKALPKDQRPEVSLHIAMGDIVDLAGGQHLEGTTYTHGMNVSGLGGAVKAHTSYLLLSNALKEQREGAGITDELLESVGISEKARSSHTGEVQEHEGGYPFWARGFGAERGRELGGLLALGAGPLYGLIAGAGLAGKGAWKGMKAAGKGIWGGMKTAGKGIWSGMKAAGRGMAGLGKSMWGGMKTMGKGIGSGLKTAGKGIAGGMGAMAKFMSAPFRKLFRQETG